MAQLVERVLGKDEVSSSNLDSSSKDHATLGMVFCFLQIRTAPFCLQKGIKLATYDCLD